MKLSHLYVSQNEFQCSFFYFCLYFTIYSYNLSTGAPAKMLRDIGVIQLLSMPVTVCLPRPLPDLFYDLCLANAYLQFKPSASVTSSRKPSLWASPPVKVQVSGTSSTTYTFHHGYSVHLSFLCKNILDAQYRTQARSSEWPLWHLSDGHFGLKLQSPTFPSASESRQAT